MDWGKILLLISTVLLIWFLYYQIRKHPHGFSRENLGKSIFTVGCLALFLIAFIALMVLVLRK
jgi:hypothetical protein